MKQAMHNSQPELIYRSSDSPPKAYQPYSSTKDMSKTNFNHTYSSYGLGRNGVSDSTLVREKRPTAVTSHRRSYTNNDRANLASAQDIRDRLNYNNKGFLYLEQHHRQIMSRQSQDPTQLQASHYRGSTDTKPFHSHRQ